MRVPLLFLALAVTTALSHATAAETPGESYRQVDVAPTRTFVGIASVGMTMTRFSRERGTYAADYRASVIPWIVFNEKGRLLVEISEEQLRALERGETITVKGRAVRDPGGERPVEAKVAPIDARHGRIKVRVSYSKRITLTFDTTYRFVDPP